MTLKSFVKSLVGADGPMDRADSDMARVLKVLEELHPEPIEELSVAEARKQPTPTDAVRTIMHEDGIEVQNRGVITRDITLPARTGALPARVYSADNIGEQPVVLYFHGGGWVIADLDVYDATPRALAADTGAVFVSVHYRQAPEHPFPSAHDDAIAAYEWLLEHARDIGGDPSRIAVMGESAGGNLAANVAIAARDRGLPQPIHQVLVYPVASTDTDTPSYEENADAKPLNKAMMHWFMDKVLTDSAQMSDPRLRLVDVPASGLPSATIITAEIDPLRDDGQRLAESFRAAGVDVEHADYTGVTHEFFGMAAVVGKARQAQALVASRLQEAFERPPTSVG